MSITTSKNGRPGTRKRRKKKNGCFAPISAAVSLSNYSLLAHALNRRNQRPATLSPGHRTVHTQFNNNILYLCARDPTIISEVICPVVIRHRAAREPVRRRRRRHARVIVPYIFPSPSPRQRAPS